MSTNPFTINTKAVTERNVIDRSSHIDRLFRAINEDRQNALVIGEHGIGKTCLLKKLRAKIIAYKGPNALLIPIDLQARTFSPPQFLEDAWIALFQAAAKAVFNMDYSTLLRTMDGRDSAAIFQSKQKEFIELYRLTHSTATEFKHERKTEAGVQAGFVGGKGELFSESTKRPTLQPAQFQALAAELLEILRNENIEQIVFFGDEANHIAPDLEIDLLKSHMDVFSSTEVQFVFAVKKEAIAKLPELKEAFPVVIDVQAFPSITEQNDLIDHYLNLSDTTKSITFNDQAREKIWQITTGHPREIQRLCRGCLDLALLSGLTVIGVETVFEACIQAYDITRVPR